MNIETLGGEKIRYLLENKIVSDFASLYELSEDKLIGVYSLTDDKKLSIQEKGAKNIITSIERSKQVPFERVLFALGIRYVGEVSAKTIARHFENIYNIINAKKEDLVLVNDVGEIVAESLVSYFSNSENLWEIDRLRQLGLRFNIEKKQTKDILMGKSFVVSGVFKDYSREEIKKVIEDNGGKSVSSLSSKTDFLVFGENMGPEKRKKAEKLNIKMISEEEFNNMLTNTNKE
jgi:DNA ligase (NAD+)